MDRALVIGGTRFIGRHTVEKLLAHDYDVTVFNRGKRPNPFADDDDRVTHVEGLVDDEFECRVVECELDHQDTAGDLAPARLPHCRFTPRPSRRRRGRHGRSVGR